MRKKNETLELCQQIMIDPITDIKHNFSIEKSRFHYEKYATQWSLGDIYQNPADKHEEVSFAYAWLDDLATQAIQAHNLFVNMKKADFVKKVDWYTYWQNVIVSWHRLKTFEEWLHDWLKDAITQHYREPEKSIQKILRERFSEWYYSNTDMHLRLEWKIDDETLQRLGKFEKPQAIKDRDLEEDIQAATEMLLEMEKGEKKSNVTVLTLRIKD